MRTNNWHGLTAISNFTWGRALGTATCQATSSTTPLSPFDLGANYGPQGFDFKFIYNLSMYYSAPFFRGQHGVLGHILGGWTISPLFTAQSGAPTAVGYSEGNAGGLRSLRRSRHAGNQRFSSTRKMRSASCPTPAARRRNTA